MPVSGIRQVREIASAELPAGWSMTEARMDLDHEGGGEWQHLTFRVIDPSGKTYEWVSDRALAREDIIELARKTVIKFVKGLSNEPPTGDSAKDGGERSDN